MNKEAAIYALKLDLYSMIYWVRNSSITATWRSIKAKQTPTFAILSGSASGLYNKLQLGDRVEAFPHGRLYRQQVKCVSDNLQQLIVRQEEEPDKIKVELVRV